MPAASRPLSTPLRAPVSVAPSQSRSITSVMQWLGSLKFTVALFSLSILIVLVGTLAQDELNMQEVKARYFLTWIAWFRFDDLFPQAFYPHVREIPGMIPVPGGSLIGVLLMVNLVAAKVTRFRLQASGTRLAAAVAFLIMGVGVASAVVFLGHNDEGLQGTPPMEYSQLWALVLASLSVGAGGLALAAASTRNSAMRAFGLFAGAALAAMVVYSLVTGYRIGDPGLRIVWQLAKGLGAGLFLMVGCHLAFGKQGGNVLIHIGVGLLMVGQFAFGDRQTEQRLLLVEGEATNTFVNLNEIELQIIHDSGDQKEVVAVPAARLYAAAEKPTLITDPKLPFRIRVLSYFENADIREGSSGDLADTGFGREVKAVPRAKFGGADTTTNLPAAYLELVELESEKSLGKFLVSQSVNDRKMLVGDVDAKDYLDSFSVNGKTFQLGLRMHREVKPYWVQLEDVRRINYSGTETPRDYSSFIRIVENESGKESRERVWMNNPLRYRGETFYQSSYVALPGGKELTGIQVVRNSGWLIPYVACSITGLGMLVHFWGTLTRFIARRRRENERVDPFEVGGGGSTQDDTKQQSRFQRLRSISVPLYLVLVTFAVVAALMPPSLLSNRLRPANRDSAFDFYAAGQIPVQFGGRVMPLDAYARQTLKAMTNHETLRLDTAPGAIRERSETKKLSGIQWLMEVASDEPTLRFLPMFRIDAQEVLAELGLDRRESKLYSLADLGKNLDRLQKLIDDASQKPVAARDFKEKKLVELNMRMRQFFVTAPAMQLPIPEVFPADLFPEGTSEATRQAFAVRRLSERMDALGQTPAPGLIPPDPKATPDAIGQKNWAPFAPAYFAMMKSGQSPDAAPAGVAAFSDMIRAYQKKDAMAFNAAVDAQLTAVNQFPVAGYNPDSVRLERWLGSNDPTSLALVLYIVAIVLGLIHFAIGSPRWNAAVWGTLAVAFVLHTIVVASRVYITGRAPVINIYSSAVFIGWAAVLAGLVVEKIFQYGTGNVLAAFSGMLTLMIAHNLTLNVGSAETMGVLQAVLDTQFWLSTHVITVSLGYVATLVAGLLGILYLIAGWWGAGEKMSSDLYRVIYGAACFGILFSFIGTVLGGLWADDSWGRFWGWDPKENGALLIVLWNALMLHARWDGMVKARGFAILAIGGNLITAWSWFGTNELGIGLHSYGFTEGMLRNLAIFFAVQIAFIVAGLAIGPRRRGEQRLSA